MKFSKLFQFLLFAAGLMNMGIVGDGGGGASVDAGGDAGAGGADDGAAATTAAATTSKPADDGKAQGKKPSDEEARLLKEVMQKKEALKEKDAALTAAQEKLKQFEGIDPEAVRKLLEAQKAAETAQLEAKGEWERLKTRMAEEHTAQTKTLQDQVTALQAQLSQKANLIDELSIGTQFGQSTFISEELTLTPAKARVVYGTHFDLVDGKIVGYDKPRGSANRTALVDQTGEPIGFDAALKKIVDADPDKNHLIKSKVRPGANSDSRRGDSKNVVKSDGSSVSKITAGLAGFNMGSSGGIA